MRLFRLSLLGLGATTAALLNGYQARAQTAYMWGSNNMHGDHEQLHYQANEVWLMEVDLATGSSNEVNNSRVFAHKEIMNHINNTSTNELVDGFVGHPNWKTLSWLVVEFTLIAMDAIRIAAMTWVILI